MHGLLKWKRLRLKIIYKQLKLMIMKLESLKSEKFRKLENEQMNKINGGAFSLAAAGSSAQTPVCTGERGGGSHADPDERDCDDDKGNWIDC